MKVLIVDDESLDLLIAKKYLSKEYEVEGFNYIYEALTWVESHSFDVLLSDFYLEKGQSASDLLKGIKEKYTKPFKAIVLTNYIDDEKKRELISSGFNAIIEKPLSLEKFNSAIG